MTPPTTDDDDDVALSIGADSESLSEDFDAGDADDATIGEEGVDVSADYQDDVTKLEQAVWHAPQGKGTKIVAVIILTLLLLSILAMLVMGIISAVG